MDALTFLSVAALLVGTLIALTQRVWPVALLCGGLIMAVLSDAGLITA